MDETLRRELKTKFEAAYMLEAYSSVAHKNTYTDKAFQFMDEQAVKDREWKDAKAFYNGSVNLLERSIVGSLTIARDYNIATRQKQDPNYQPMQEGVAILDDILQSDHLQPYAVKGDSTAEQYRLDLMQGAGQLAVQAGAAVLTGPVGSTALMGAQIAGNQYLDLRAEGVDVERAAGASIANAIMQTPLERLSLNKILKGVPANSGLKKKLLQIGESALTEGLTEFAQQYPEEITNLIARNEGKTAREIAAEFDTNAGEYTKNALYAASIGAILGGGASSLRVALDRNIHKTQLETLDDRIDAVSQSGVESDFAASIINANTGNATVSIDGEVLYQYAQTQNINELAAELGIEAGDIQKAAADGLDVEILQGNFEVTAGKRHDFYEAVRDTVAFESGGTTVNSAKMQSEIRKQSQKLEASNQEFEVWKDEKLGQLLGAGLNKSEAISTMAFLESTARTYNPVDPTQYFRDHPLEVKRVVSTSNGRYLQNKSASEKLLEDENNFSSIADEYVSGEISDTKTYNVMTTPLALELAGGKILPVTIDGSKIKHIFDGHSDGMTPELLKQIPRAMADPMMILDSYAGRKIVVLDLKDNQGSTIIVPLELDVERSWYKVNAIASAYGKGGESGTDYNWFIEHNLKKGRVAYVNKEKTAKWLPSPSSDSASRITDLDSLLNNSIPDENALRKRREEMQGYYQTAFHGSPHKFEKFDLGAVGTGTGIQAHGWGLYFAFSKNTAKRYRDGLKGSTDEGSLFEVDIPEDAVLLHENRFLYQQPEQVRNALEKLGADLGHGVTTIDLLYTDLFSGDRDTVGNSGRAIYKNLFFYFRDYEGLSNSESMKKASLLLNKYGIKGIRYNGERDGESYVIFDDQAIKIINSYNQKVNNDKKGSIHWDAEGKAIIDLFEGADMSTVIHEAIGHYFVENLMKYSELPTATEQMRKDRQIMLEYAEITESEWSEFNKPHSQLTEAQMERKTAVHERWATAAEQYMMLGKAPSPELRGAMKRFKDWLLNIYKTVDEFVKNHKYAVAITPEVKAVFDRMLASRDAIESMERVDAYFAKLPDVITDNMSEASKKRLQDVILKAHDKAVSLITAESLANFTGERKQKIEEYRAEVLPGVREDLSRQPLYMAEQMLVEDFSKHKTGKAVGRYYNSLIARTLDIEAKPLTEAETLEVMQFDTIAEFNGFKSGDELAQALLSEPSLNQAVTEKANVLVNERFPDIMAERKSAEEAAREALYNDDSGLVIGVEYQIIEDAAAGIMEHQRSTEAMLSLARARRQQAKAAAKAELAGMKMQDAINVRRYMAAERKAFAKSIEYAAKKDFPKAAEYKRQQALNNALVQESAALKAKHDSWKRYIMRQLKAKKETWGTDQHFNQAGALFARMGLPKRGYNAETRMQTLAEYVAEINTERDGNAGIASWLLDESVDLTNPLKALNPAQFEDVIDALKNIKTIGRYENQARIADREETLADLKSKVLDATSKMKTRWEGGPNSSNKTSAITDYFIEMTSADNFFEEADGWTQGTFSEVFADGVQAAANKESRYIFEYEKAMSDAILELAPTRQERNALARESWNEELQANVTRYNLIKMLAYMGTESSRNKLCSTDDTSTYKEFFSNSSLWVEGDAQQTRDNLIEFLGRTLTEAEIKYTQKLVDASGKAWNELVEVERRTKGFAPQKEEATPILLTLVSGKKVAFAGGYLPLVRYSDSGSKPMSTNIVTPTDGFVPTNNIRTMSTVAGSTKSRDNSVYPLDLRPGAESWNIRETIHDVAFRETIDTYRKLLSDSEVYSQLKRKFGVKRFKVLLQYVENAARTNDGATEDITSTLKIVNLMRRKLTNTVILGNLKILSQNYGNPMLYGNNVEGFGHSDVIGAYAKFYKNINRQGWWREQTEFAYQKSAWMRERSQSPDYTLTVLREEQWQKEGFAKFVNDVSVEAMVFTDNMTALPVWIEAYHKKINSGASEDIAVRYADTVVRRGLGATRRYDVAPVMRGGPWAKLFTMFQSFANARYNEARREVGIAQSLWSKGDKEKAFKRALSYLIAKYFAFTLISTALAFEDPFEEDDRDGYLNWFKELLTYPTTMLGPVGGAASAMISTMTGMSMYGYRITPIQSVPEQVLRMGSKVRSVAEGKADSEELIEPAAGLLGLYFEVPNQVNKIVFNAYDILHNDMTPRLSDVIRRRPKKERGE